jgi:peptidoglycan/LPS O-acetylase OafA/YrhL
MATNNSSKKRLIQLDVLRGVAVLGVVGFHGTNLTTPEKSGFVHQLYQFFNIYAGVGLDLFFVLSGFLVGGLLLREIDKTGNLQLKRFILRRGLKIWPLYYIFIAYCIFLPVLKSDNTLAGAIEPLIPNLFHVQNYFYTPYNHTWTLSLEEHFYLFLPLMLYFLLKRNRLHLVPIVALLILVTCPLLRWLTISFNPLNPNDGLQWMWKVITPTHLRIDALVAGVLIAYFYHLRPESLRIIRDSVVNRWLLFLIGIAIISTKNWLRVDESTAVIAISLGLTLNYIGAGCVLLAFMYSVDELGEPMKIFKSPISRILGFVGFYSYAIYLWHMDEALRRVLHLKYLGYFDSFAPDTRWVIVMTLYLSFAVFVGVVTSRLVEIPMLAFRDRIFPAPVNPVTKDS